MRDGEERLGVGWSIFGAEWLEGNKTLAEQPRPDNLIPIIGFPEKFLVMFGAGKTQLESKQKSVSPDP